jgi:hypothetical protein
MYNKGNLSRLKKMDILAPEVMKAFWSFDKAAVAPEKSPSNTRNSLPSRSLLQPNVPIASLFTAAMHAKQVPPTRN